MMLSLNLFMTETFVHMVIDHPNSLHKRINNSSSHKLKSSFFKSLEIFSERAVEAGNSSVDAQLLFRGLLLLKLHM